MQVIRIEEHGGPEVLRLTEADAPSPGPGQVLVQVKAAGVNFFDTQIRSGLYTRPLPIALGTEGAGVVQAVGPDVTDVSVGDRVAWILAPGSYATHALVPVSRLAPLPERVDFETAAATIYQALTAHYLGCSSYELGPDDVCIVHSAAGGVGALLCQVAKIRGARVLGTVSADTKRAVAHAAGADHVVNYTQHDFAAEAKRLTDGNGVDVVFDAVGLETFERSLASLKRRGLLVLYGEASGLVPPIDVRQLLHAGSVYLTRTGLDHYVTDRCQLLERCADIFTWLGNGLLR
jgi:NADPH:quinone reductase